MMMGTKKFIPKEIERKKKSLSPSPDNDDFGLLFRTQVVEINKQTKQQPNSREKERKRYVMAIFEHAIYKPYCICEIVYRIMCTKGRTFKIRSSILYAFPVFFKIHHIIRLWFPFLVCYFLFIQCLFDCWPLFSSFSIAQKFFDHCTKHRKD